MGDWFSLSVLQMFSIVCFVLLAVARIGSVHLGRLQHKFEANVQQPAATVAASVKIPMWSWKVSGLPVSFSLGSLLGEDEEQDEGKDGMVGYDGGSTLVRMDWQLSRPATVIPQPQFTQPPLSMAKLIMTRHLQRKPGRSLRRMQGTMRPPTRLSQSAVL